MHFIPGIKEFTITSPIYAMSPTSPNKLEIERRKTPWKGNLKL